MGLEKTLKNNLSLPPHAKILIVLMGSLGDVVRGFAVADQLKRNFPQIHISWLIEPKCAAIAKLCTAIDEIILYERGKGIRALFTLSIQLRRRRFDVVLDLQRHAKSGFFSLLAPADRRIGFHRKNAKEGNWLFSHETIPYLEEDRISKLHLYLSFVRHLGGQILEPIRFPLSSTLSPSTDALLTSPLRNSWIGVVLGSSWESKDWPEVGYSTLLDRIASTYGASFGVVLLGDSSQQERSQRILSSRSGSISPVLSLVGKTNIEELVAVITRMKACVGPDSGPAHIAGAVGVPYVTIFGPTSPQKVAPYGSEHLIIAPTIGCAPCYRRRCPGLGGLCMRLTTAEEVFSMLQEALVMPPVNFSRMS